MLNLADEAWFREQLAADPEIRERVLALAYDPDSGFRPNEARRALEVIAEGRIGELTRHPTGQGADFLGERIPGTNQRVEWDMKQVSADPDSIDRIVASVRISLHVNARSASM